MLHCMVVGYVQPPGLSPSRISAFTSCPLQFRFNNTEGVVRVGTPHTEKGSLVHRAFEFFYKDVAAGSRSEQALADCLTRAVAEWVVRPEWLDLGYDDDQAVEFFEDAARLALNIFLVEDPDSVDVVETELRISLDVDGVPMRGVIDRLDRSPDGLVVVDYKTGKVPNERWESSSMVGVNFYAMLCEQHLGERPAKIRLVYVQDGTTIEATPSEQSVRGIRGKSVAVWKAILKAGPVDGFRPRQSKLCDWCGFQEYCPAWGGSIEALDVALATPA